MLQGITRLAIGAPRRVIAVVLLVMVGTAIFGFPVTKNLSAGGFRDPTSESSHAAKLLSDKFGQGDMTMIVSVTSNGGVESGAARGGHRYRPKALGLPAHRPGHSGFQRQSRL